MKGSLLSSTTSGLVVLELYLEKFWHVGDWSILASLSFLHRHNVSTCNVEISLLLHGRIIFITKLSSATETYGCLT